MNKIQIVINVILVAAVATLFGIVLAGKKPAAKEVAAVDPSEVLPVAYLNVDSLSMRVAMTELQPWAMLAKGPPWMIAGVCSRV